MFLAEPLPVFFSVCDACPLSGEVLRRDLVEYSLGLKDTEVYVCDSLEDVHV